MPGTAGKVGDYLQRASGEHSVTLAHLMEAFEATQPQFQKALLNIAEMYAERYPAPKGVYIV